MGGINLTLTFSGSNLDPLTETYGLSFYMQYLAHWPEYFQVAESPSGEIMGYSKCAGRFSIQPVLLVFFLSIFSYGQSGRTRRQLARTRYRIDGITRLPTSRLSGDINEISRRRFREVRTVFV